RQELQRLRPAGDDPIEREAGGLVALHGAVEAVPVGGPARVVHDDGGLGGGLVAAGGRREQLPREARRRLLPVRRVRGDVGGSGEGVVRGLDGRGRLGGRGARGGGLGRGGRRGGLAAARRQRGEEQHVDQALHGGDLRVGRL